MAEKEPNYQWSTQTARARSNQRGIRCGVETPLCHCVTSPPYGGREWVPGASSVQAHPAVDGQEAQSYSALPPCGGDARQGRGG